VVFDGDGLIIGTLGAVSIWDVTNPAAPVQVMLLGDLNSRDEVNGSVAVSRSGLLAVTSFINFPSSFYAGQTGVQLWNISAVLGVIADPIAAACRIDGGRLTAGEWHAYAPSLPRRAICG
jgi:hypothetical protein